MKSLLTLTLFILTLPAQAEVFNCTFTGPDLSLRYDTAKEILTETSLRKKVTSHKGVSFDIKNSGTFILKNRQVQLELKLNNEGSDGTSENVFPYEAKFTKQDEVIFGGCTSNLKGLIK